MMDGSLNGVLVSPMLLLDSIDCDEEAMGRNTETQHD